MSCLSGFWGSGDHLALARLGRLGLREGNRSADGVHYLIRPESRRGGEVFLLAALTKIKHDIDSCRVVGSGRRHNLLSLKIMMMCIDDVTCCPVSLVMAISLILLVRDVLRPPSPIDDGSSVMKSSATMPRRTSSVLCYQSLIDG